MMCATDTKEELTTSITIGCLSFVQASCDKRSAKISAVQDLNLRPSDLQSLALPTLATDGFARSGNRTHDVQRILDLTSTAFNHSAILAVYNSWC